MQDNREGECYHDDVYEDNDNHNDHSDHDNNDDNNDDVDYDDGDDDNNHDNDVGYGANASDNDDVNDDITMQTIVLLRRTHEVNGVNSIRKVWFEESCLSKYKPCLQSTIISWGQASCLWSTDMQKLKREANVL